MAAGYVYFVYAFRVRRVKIGYSGSYPDGRFNTLQTGCPVKLRRLGFVRGTPADEKRLQWTFSSEQRCGEWFDLSPRLGEFIRDNASRWPTPVSSGRADERYVRAHCPNVLSRQFESPKGTMCYEVMEKKYGRQIGFGRSALSAWVQAATRLRDEAERHARVKAEIEANEMAFRQNQIRPALTPLTPSAPPPA